MDHFPSEHVRFGRFELNVRTGELHSLEAGNDGQRLVLPEQPFQILRMLVGRGGKVVSREEIKRALWPNDTIVDFGHSINVAIGILRRALSDSAANPQYIETLARRGYRLMVATEWFVTEAELPAPKTTRQAEPATTQERLDAGNLIGKKISHYRVLEVIGGGGMGMVYKAEDLKLGRRVALKFLPDEWRDDQLALRRFEREAQTASAMNHPNICTIYEIEDYAGRPFIAMELLQGEPLQQRLANTETRPLSLASALEIAVQICDGLQAAHDKGIIHRDIKPANIFLTELGPVKILDFGLAKLATDEEKREIPAIFSASVSSGENQDFEGFKVTPLADSSFSLTRTGIAAGTAGYMSPEQVRREKLDARTDLFSFGLVLYEMSVGQRAFTGDTVAEMHEAILTQTLRPVRELNSAIPRSLAVLIDKALEKDKALRCQSVAEMRAGLMRAQREMRPAWRRVRTWAVAAILLLAVLAGVRELQQFRNRVTLSTTDTIVRSDIDNRTTDSAFGGLNIALEIALEETPYLNILGRDKMRETLELLKLPEDAKVTPEIGRQICLRTDSKMVVDSSIADAGNGYRLELRLVDCKTGRVVTEVRNDVTTRADVVHALGASTILLRRKLGEASDSIARFNKPLDQATSSSPEALAFLTQAYNAHIAGNLADAVTYYQRAIELDNNLALAHAGLGSASQALGDYAMAIAEGHKAFELRERLTEPTRFHVETLYYGGSTGEWEKEYSIANQWVQEFPRDVLARTNLLICLQHLGKHDEALVQAREALRMIRSSFSYFNVLSEDIATNNWAEGRAVFDDAVAHNFDSPRLHTLHWMLAFLQNDASAMQGDLKWARQNPAQRYQVIDCDSWFEAFHGRLRNSGRLMRESVQESARPDPTITAYYLHSAALQEVEAGNPIQGQQLAEEGLKASGDYNSKLLAALVFARSGRADEAQKLADAVDREQPRDSLVQKYCLPAIRAAISLYRNDPSAAIEILRVHQDYDLAYTDTFNNLYPAYLRGLAYLQMGQGHQAAAEFQKILDHPGIMGGFVTGALARLQLARAQAMTGDDVAARKSYQQFLSLWKNADPDIPIYKQAKAEYAGLR